LFNVHRRTRLAQRLARFGRHPHVLPSMGQKTGVDFDEAKPPYSPSEAGGSS
jgi:hypothetical protein